MVESTESQFDWDFLLNNVISKPSFEEFKNSPQGVNHIDKVGRNLL